MINLLFYVYVTAVALLASYGAVGLLTMWLYVRHRQEELERPPEPDVWPHVTVQLPIFNERFVVEQLIETAVQLEYPREKLQIQIVDDSTDDTTPTAKKLVQFYQAQGINIQLLHRHNREGYKAGALAEALPVAMGRVHCYF